eukprot:772674-Rhodomonas_salina.1
MPPGLYSKLSRPAQKKRGKMVKSGLRFRGKGGIRLAVSRKGWNQACGFAERVKSTRGLAERAKGDLLDVVVLFFEEVLHGLFMFRLQREREKERERERELSLIHI